MNFKVADCHTHIYPQKIAAKAVESIGDFYHIEMRGDGLPSSLAAASKKAGITKSLVFSVATSPAQVASINDFILEKCKKYPQFMAVASMHPDFADYEAELERISTLGFKGVKFHPDFQKFDINDKRMLPVYRKIAALNLPVIFHMGDSRYDFSSPYRLADLAQQLPELTCIAAHFGGYEKWDDAAVSLKDSPVLFDTSSSLAFISPEYARDLIDHFGAQRFLFGSDFPMWDPSEELERFMAIPIDDAARESILSGNFVRIFNEII